LATIAFVLFKNQRAGCFATIWLLFLPCFAVLCLLAKQRAKQPKGAYRQSLKASTTFLCCLKKPVIQSAKHRKHSAKKQLTRGRRKPWQQSSFSKVLGKVFRFREKQGCGFLCLPQKFLKGKSFGL
jgi:hypothetical protein